MYRSRTEAPALEAPPPDGLLPSVQVRLRLLGGIWAELPGGERTAEVGEKPLGVLAFLLHGRPRGLKRRDEIAGLFWPDLNTARSRRGLRQAIHALRSCFGCEIVRSVGKHSLEVAPGLVDSDVAAFRRARDAGRLVDSLELYGGEFMAGARLLNTAAELDEWVRAERYDLEQAAIDSAAVLAARAAGSGDGTAATRWGARAMALARGDEGVVRRLLRVCADGDLPDVAVELYERHSDWLARQGDLRPTPATRALFADLFAPT